jgi:hypothetical protein
VLSGCGERGVRCSTQLPPSPVCACFTPLPISHCTSLPTLRPPHPPPSGGRAARPSQSTTAPCLAGRRVAAVLRTRMRLLAGSTGGHVQRGRWRVEAAARNPIAYSRRHGITGGRGAVFGLSPIFVRSDGLDGRRCRHGTSSWQRPQACALMQPGRWRHGCCARRDRAAGRLPLSCAVPVLCSRALGACWALRHSAAARAPPPCAWAALPGGRCGGPSPPRPLCSRRMRRQRDWLCCCDGEDGGPARRRLG